MTTHLSNAIRESVATTWTTGCTTVLPNGPRDLDARGTRMHAAERPVQPAIAGTPSFGAAFEFKARAATSAPGTTACRPPT